MTPLDPPRPEVVATIGVFDGVHRGHRSLLEAVIARARSLGVPSLVITFDPHPISILAPGAPPHLLTPRPAKTRILAEVGIDLVWFLPFSRSLAALTPESFLEDLLLRAVRPREIRIGHDFRFGHDRRGDFELLREFGQRLGFSVRRHEAVREEGRILSSSRVRRALERGEIAEAERILGHSVLLEGVVGAGRGEGHRLLVPTANLELPAEQFLPGRGVYAAWAELGGALCPAVANVGVRPTLTRDERATVEVHLIDWAGDLRGRILPVHLSRRLRPERKFESLEALRAAVLADIERARALLASGGGPGAGFPAPRPASPDETRH